MGYDATITTAAGGHPEKGTIEAYTLGTETVPGLPVPGIGFAQLKPEWVSALATTMGVAEAEVQGRLAAYGSAAVALTDQGAIAGYGWVRYDAILIEPIRLLVPLDPGHAYIWDCLTLPEQRGRGVFAGLLRFLLEALRREGVRQVWAGVAPGNVASLRAFARAGFHIAATTRPSDDGATVWPAPAARPEEVATLRRRVPW